MAYLEVAATHAFYIPGTRQRTTIGLDLADAPKTAVEFIVAVCFEHHYLHILKYMNEGRKKVEGLRNKIT
jgi:hypothetical protein